MANKYVYESSGRRNGQDIHKNTVSRVIRMFGYGIEDDRWSSNHQVIIEALSDAEYLADTVEANQIVFERIKSITSSAKGK